MATIRTRKTKAGEPRYEVQVRLKGAPPERATFRKLKEAKEWAAEREAEVRARRVGRRRKVSDVTLAQAIDRFIDERMASLSETERAHRSQILRYWRRRYGHLRLRDIDPDHVSRAAAELRASGRSGATSNRYVAALSAVLQSARRSWGWIDFNAAREIRRERESAGRVRYLSDEERSALLAACAASRNPRLAQLVTVALYTGARQGELLNLRWEDVDLERRVATLWETKNSENRTIPLPGPAVRALLDLGADREGLVFGLRVFPRQAWYFALDRAGLQSFRFHDLRHSAASMLAQSGASLLDIATILGHKTMAMVKRYSHLSPSHLSEVSDRMADKFKPLAPGDPTATD